MLELTDSHEYFKETRFHRNFYGTGLGAVCTRTVASSIMLQVTRQRLMLTMSTGRTAGARTLIRAAAGVGSASDLGSHRGLHSKACLRRRQLMTGSSGTAARPGPFVDLRLCGAITSPLGEYQQQRCMGGAAAITGQDSGRGPAAVSGVSMCQNTRQQLRYLSSKPHKKGKSKGSSSPQKVAGGARETGSGRGRGRGGGDSGGGRWTFLQHSSQTRELIHVRSYPSKRIAFRGQRKCFL